MKTTVMKTTVFSLLSLFSLAFGVSSQAYGVEKGEEAPKTSDSRSALGKEFERAVAEATLNPSPENMAKVKKLNEQIIEQAAKFAEEYQRAQKEAS